MSYQRLGPDGLGLSFKPPKWLRKAQPGKILKKIALPVAAIGASLLIPGVAPAVVAVSKGAAGLIVRGVVGAGKAGAGLVRGALKPSPAPRSVLPRIFQTTMPVIRPITQVTPSPGSPPPPPPIVSSTPTSPDVMAPSGGGWNGGGGGGGGGALQQLEPDQSDAQAAEQPNGKPAFPVLPIAGVALLLLMSASGSRRK